MAEGSSTGPLMAKRFTKPCAIIYGGESGPAVGGRRMNMSDIDSGFDITVGPHDPWHVHSCLRFLHSTWLTDRRVGFWLEFPHGPDNEDSGFGVCHRSMERHFLCLEDVMLTRTLS